MDKGKWVFWAGVAVMVVAYFIGEATGALIVALPVILLTWVWLLNRG